MRALALALQERQYDPGGFVLGNLLNGLQQRFLTALPRKSAELEAKLQGVNGFTGRGEIEFTEWENGARVMEVELRGVAGRTAEVFAENEYAATIDLDNGRAERKFHSRRGDDVPSLLQGCRVEIRQNGDVILEGVLAPD